MLKPFLAMTAIILMGAISFPSLAVAEGISHVALIAEHQKVTTKTVTLSVPGMTCRVCPITVKKALESVKGVSKVSVDFDAKTAIVTFNSIQASVSDLTEATKKAGYPSSMKSNLK